ncbi:hypothetical protein NMY22_g11036 [Coprinellus aureogranulatus]|nr:hypothetical protein NMY22_g11036 [Coprinellus aureogranulatus]
MLFSSFLASVSLPLVYSLSFPIPIPLGRVAGTVQVGASEPTGVSGMGGGSANDSDLRVLNFAISIENLVSAFLSQGLTRFSAIDFRNAGYPTGPREFYAGMLSNGRSHIDSLVSSVRSANFTVIGTCQYAFPMETVQDFIDLSEAISILSASTYTGIISSLDSKPYIALLASILSVEGRQASWISSLRGRTPVNSAFETPVTFNQTWSIAKNFVTSCPPSNDPAAVLPSPLHNIPTLQIPPQIRAGERMTVAFADDLYTGGLPLHAVFRSGNSQIAAPVVADVGGEQSVTVPSQLIGMGAVWVVVVQRGEPGDASDANTVAGPALAIFPSDSGDHLTEQNAWSW